MPYPALWSTCRSGSGGAKAPSPSRSYEIDSPLRGGVYKCALQSVDEAIAGGLYGSWNPSGAQVARLREIFPTGVCDYSRGDVAG